MAFTLKQIAFGSADHEAEIRLRMKILRVPLGLVFSSEALAREHADFHLGAFEGQTLLACLVLTPQSERVVKMRQVAVDSDRQGRGIGKSLVAYSETFAREKGFTEMELNARDTAVPFYLALGYAAVGIVFEEVGIPHLKMHRELCTFPP